MTADTFSGQHDTLRRTVPPLPSLIAFEATVRLGTMTMAAEELAVSRVAISRQVRNFEFYLETKLFQRTHHAVMLTDAGKRYYQDVRPSLYVIASATDRIRERLNRPGAKRSEPK